MHNEVVKKITNRHFSTAPQAISRKATGICNEVYEVKLSDQSVIIRVGVTNDRLRGSSKYIPLFKQHGIKVPEILAEDYSCSTIPYPYQILTKLEGQDLIEVIHELTDDQLSAIAKEIAHIIQTLAVIPTNGKFGWVGYDESRLVDSLHSELLRDLNEATDVMKQTGVYDQDLCNAVMNLLEDNRDYLEQTKSTFYYDDLNSKNVMIHDGQFNGLVDLDGVQYGDPIRVVGAIRANWPGTHFGDLYTEQVMDALNYGEAERRMVDVYATFHRYYWMSGNGVQFNANTQATVNQNKLASDRKAVEMLIDKIAR